MEFTSSFEEYECVLSKDKHIVKQPITLRCGHYVCKNCIVDYNAVKCSKCGEVNSVRNDKESIIAKEMIKRNIEQLFKIVETSFTKTYAEFKENKELVLSINQRIGSYIEHMRYEVEIRIESLKNELDSINQEFQGQLNEIEESLTRKYDLINVKAKIEDNFYERRLIELKNNIENKININDNSFYLYQDELRNLNNDISAIHKIKDEVNDISFNVSTKPIKRDIIGKLLTKSIKTKQINQMLQQKPSKTINLTSQCNDLCILPNGYLILANSSLKNLTVYDEHFSLVLTIDKINNQKIQSLFLTTNNIDKIYITDFTNHQIIMTDFDFNFLKSTGFYNQQMDQLKYPCGICYSNNNLFVCDLYNKRVHKLDENIEFLKSYELDYTPWQIKVAGHVACVKPYNVTTIYFYELDTFKLKYKYEGHSGTISVLNSCFYEYFSSNKKFYCYNDSGELIEEYRNDCLAEFLNDTNDGALCWFNEMLVLSSFSMQKLLILNDFDC